MKNKKKYDVIVVGAGISGLCAAGYLALNDIKVLVIEKEKKAGLKLCAGGLTCKSVEFLKKIPFLSTEDISRIIVSSSDRFSIKFKNIEVMNGKSHIPYYFTHRYILDNVFVEKCIENNVDFLFNTKVMSISNKGLVRTKKHIFKAQRIINAKGVSEHFDQNLKSGNFYFTLQLEFNKTELKQEFCTNFIYGYVRRGYGWIFPAGEKIFIGIGSRDVNEVRKAFNTMLDDLHIDIKHKKIRGAWIPCFEKENMVNSRIISTGDSLALTSPLFGEGIYNALFSGKLAADCISENISIHNFRKRIRKEILYTNRFEMIMSLCFYKILEIFKQRALYFFMKRLGKEIFLTAHGCINYLRLFTSGRIFIRLLKKSS